MVNNRYNNVRECGICNYRRMGFIAACICMLVAISIFSVSMALASDKQPAHQYSNKYYTSIDIEKNDTLWGIAQQYACSGADIDEYIKNIKSINRLSGDNITQGQSLIVYYYSDEIK